VRFSQRAGPRSLLARTAVEAAALVAAGLANSTNFSIY
jgi:hypothetical protein